IRRKLADEPLGWHTEQLYRPLLARSGPDNLVEAVQLVDQVRNLIVGVRHVDIRPDHDAALGHHRAVLPGRPGAPIGVEPNGAHAEALRELTRSICRAVVHDDYLVGVRGSVERLLDAS